jgi:hypothetical protein
MKRLKSFLLHRHLKNTAKQIVKAVLEIDTLLRKPCQEMYCSVIFMTPLLYRARFWFLIKFSAPSNCTTMETQVLYGQPHFSPGSVFEMLCRYVTNLYRAVSLHLVLSFYVLDALEEYDGSREHS